jgi:hypothetical protein
LRSLDLSVIPLTSPPFKFRYNYPHRDGTDIIFPETILPYHDKKESPVKKIIGFLMVAALAALFVSCGGDGSSTGMVGLFVTDAFRTTSMWWR